MIFQVTEMMLSAQQIPRSSFLPSSKMSTVFPIFQSPRTLPDCHDFSNVTEWLSEYIRPFPQPSELHLISSYRHIYIQLLQLVMNLTLAYSASDLTPPASALSTIHSESVRRGGAIEN